jgi:hypothetical protein
MAAGAADEESFLISMDSPFLFLGRGQCKASLFQKERAVPRLRLSLFHLNTLCWLSFFATGALPHRLGGTPEPCGPIPTQGRGEKRGRASERARAKEGYFLSAKCFAGMPRGEAAKNIA